MLQISKFINDDKQWEIEKIFDKKDDKKMFNIKLSKRVEIRNIINDFQKKIRSNVEFNTKVRWKTNDEAMQET